MSTTVFPVDGAANAAELFALLAGHSNATDFVDDGLTVSVDTSTDTATLSAGTCYIQLDSDTVTGTSKQVRDLGYVVQIDEQTVSIPTSGTVTLAVVPDYSAPNKAAVEYYSTASDVPSEALSIATVDCDNGTVTAYNRAPDIDAESLSVIGEATISGDLTVAQDIVLDGQLKQADGTVLFGPDDPIPSAQLSDSAVTIQTSGDLTGGGSVALGDSVTLGTDVPVTSVHGRTGAVSAATGDYTHAQIASVSADDHHTYPVPNTGLVNDTVTVSAGGDLTGGGQVTLGGSVTISADVHDRYTNAEAVDAVDGAISVAASSVGNLDEQVNTNISNISSLQSNKLEQSAYTPEADTHDEFTPADAITAIDGEISSAASTVSALDTQVSTNTTDISALQSGKLDQSTYNPESDTHNKYTDSEAVSAINEKLSAAASTVSALDTAVSSNAGAINSLQTNKLDSASYTPVSDTHSRYTDSEAVGAVDGEVSTAASSVNGLDAQVASNDGRVAALESKLNDYEIQVDGSGGTNVINLKTE